MNNIYVNVTKKVKINDFYSQNNDKMNPLRYVIHQ